MGISRLAAFAADPEGFVERNGGARDPAAAAYGRAAHREAVRPPAPIKAFIVYAVLLGVLLLALYYLVLP
ncbi:MAG: hypothetical protein EA417_07410 [Gammaproteobacteria bacterium]|nr:MAG: hypothetical protein EA417_07410 [Gammaproteobacteria bacterium]